GVLVVAGNATLGRTVSELAAGWAMRPTIVDSQAAAEQALREAGASGDRFRIVLLDGSMPGALEVARCMRDDSSSGTAGVAMLTLAAGPDAVLDYQKAGISAHVMKPMHPADLLRAVRTAVRA